LLLFFFSSHRFPEHLADFFQEPLNPTKNQDV